MFWLNVNGSRFTTPAVLEPVVMGWAMFMSSAIKCTLFWLVAMPTWPSTVPTRRELAPLLNEKELALLAARAPTLFALTRLTGPAELTRRSGTVSDPAAASVMPPTLIRARTFHVPAAVIAALTLIVPELVLPIRRTPAVTWLRSA